MAAVSALATALGELVPAALRVSRRQAGQLRRRVEQLQGQLVLAEDEARALEEENAAQANEIVNLRLQILDERLDSQGALEVLVLNFNLALAEAERGELTSERIAQMREVVLGPHSRFLPPSALPGPAPSVHDEDEDGESDGGSSGMYSSGGSSM
jgi:hypothetical protein